MIWRDDGVTPATHKEGETRRTKGFAFFPMIFCIPRSPFTHDTMWVWLNHFIHVQTYHVFKDGSGYWEDTEVTVKGKKL